MRRETNQEESGVSTTDGERVWRVVLFVLSAAMAAYGLVQLAGGRVAGAVGDVGVACLLISLIPQFPFVRAVLGRASKANADEDLLRDLDRVRRASPWVESASAAGWVLLGASFLLRAIGVG